MCSVRFEDQARSRSLSPRESDEKSNGLTDRRGIEQALRDRESLVTHLQHLLLLDDLGLPLALPVVPYFLGLHVFIFCVG